MGHDGWPIAPPWSRVRATCSAPATGGTFDLQGSNDGFAPSAFYLDSVPVTTAAAPIKLEARAQMTSVRIFYVPGANAANITTAMSLHTAQVWRACRRS